MERTDEEEIGFAQSVMESDGSHYTNGLALCAVVRGIAFQPYLKIQMFVLLAENNSFFALFLYQLCKATSFLESKRFY